MSAAFKVGFETLHGGMTIWKGLRKHQYDNYCLHPPPRLPTSLTCETKKEGKKDGASKLSLIFWTDNLQRHWTLLVITQNIC